MRHPIPFFQNNSSFKQTSSRGSAFFGLSLLFIGLVPNVALSQDCLCNTGEPSPILEGLNGRTSTTTPRFLVNGDVNNSGAFTLIQKVGNEERNLPLRVEVVEENTGFGRDILRISPTVPLDDNSIFELRDDEGISYAYATSEAIARPETLPPSLLLKNALRTCCAGVGAELSIIAPIDDELILAYRVELRQGSASTVLYALAGEPLLLGTKMRGEGGEETCQNTAALPKGIDEAIEVFVTSIDIEGNESAPAYASGKVRVTSETQCAAGGGCSHTQKALHPQKELSSSNRRFSVLFLAGLFVFIRQKRKIRSVKIKK